MVTAQLAPVAATMKIGMAVLTLALTLNPIANGASRLFWGWVSDHFGRERTMVVAFLLQSSALVSVLTLGSPLLGVVHRLPGDGVFHLGRNLFAVSRDLRRLFWRGATPAPTTASSTAPREPLRFSAAGSPRSPLRENRDVERGFLRQRRSGPDLRRDRLPVAQDAPAGESAQCKPQPPNRSPKPKPPRQAPNKFEFPLNRCKSNYLTFPSVHQAADVSLPPELLKERRGGHEARVDVIGQTGTSDSFQRPRFGSIRTVLSLYSARTRRLRT